MLRQWFSTGNSFVSHLASSSPHREHLAMSGDTFGYHSWKAGAYLWHLVCRDRIAFEDCTTCKTVLSPKGLVNREFSLIMFGQKYLVKCSLKNICRHMYQHTFCKSSKHGSFRKGQRNPRGTASSLTVGPPWSTWCAESAPCLGRSPQNSSSGKGKCWVDFLCCGRVSFHFPSFPYLCVNSTHNQDTQISAKGQGILYVSNQAEKIPFQPKASTCMECNNSERSTRVGLAAVETHWI